jgi:glutamate synthase domain-containing protein 2
MGWKGEVGNPAARCQKLMTACSKMTLCDAIKGIACIVMSTIEVSHLTLREKFQVMESLWEDLRHHVERLQIPQSHQNILDTRRQKVDSGACKLRQWDEAKHDIGAR